jgi:hypothetical protein
MQVHRSPLRHALPIALLLLAAGRLHAAGWPHDAGRGLPIAVAPLGQQVNGIVSDTHGGVDIVYCDPCSTYTFPYPPLPAISLHAVHVLKGGDLDPRWPPASRVLPTFSAFGCSMLADGSGGFFFAWEDARSFATNQYDVYMHHLRADGALDPAWPASGRALCTAPGAQFVPHLATDGAGGVIAVWTDRRDSVTNRSDLYGTRVRANGTLDPAWPVNGRAIYAGPLNQSVTDVVPDGSGGVIVLDQDSRNSSTTSTDVYALHVLGNGTLDPAWPAGGAAVVVAPGTQQFPLAVTDGVGGAYVSWDAGGVDARMTHLLANGTIHPAWPVGGLSLDPTAGYLQDIQFVADGQGGVIAACESFADPSDTTASIVVRHVLANGQFDSTWPANGLRIQDPVESRSLNPGLFTNSAMVPDGHDGVILSYVAAPSYFQNPTDFRITRVRGGGVVDADWNGVGRRWATPPSRPFAVSPLANGDGTTTLVWSDLRDSAVSYVDVYAQRLTDDGHLGLAAPAIHSVKDVPNDQGGRLTLTWYASAYDTLPAGPVDWYDVWRQIDASVAARVRQAGAGRLWPGTGPPRPGDVRAGPNATQDVFWEFMGSVPARGVINYALTVNTRADSSASGPAREVYVVDGRSTALGLYVASDPDSGYSLDNIPPVAPAPFTATYTAGSGSVLAWGNNVEPDLAGYRLYRGSTASFTPSPATLVYDGVNTTAHDGGGPAYFKVGAYDRSGNIGPFATVLSGGSVGIDPDGVPRALALARTGANPTLGGASLRMELPHATAVRVQVFDAQGREVRRLVDAVQRAGSWPLRWDGRDATGSDAHAGLYFIRMQAEGRALEQRVVLLR